MLLFFSFAFGEGGKGGEKVFTRVDGWCQGFICFIVTSFRALGGFACVVSGVWGSGFLGFVMDLIEGGREEKGVLVWAGVVWCGLIWCSLVWCSLFWCSLVWHSLFWCSLVWCSLVWSCLCCAGLRCAALIQVYDE